MHTRYNPDDLLLPYQKNWLEDKSQLKIAEKSRRTGLTWAEAADAVLIASKSKTAQGSDHFYVGSNKKMATEFIDACAMWAKAFNQYSAIIQQDVLANEDKDILTFTINFPSGYKIQALSSNPNNLRGMQGNVTIDEAAFHDRLAEVLKAALALTMWGSKVRLISTHNGVDSLFNELINDSRAGKKDYSVHRLTLDDACNMGLYRRICQLSKTQWSQDKEDQWKAGLLKNTATKDDALEEYFCVPKQGGGAYLSRMLIESCMFPAPVFRFSGDSDFNQASEGQRIAAMNDWLEEHVKPALGQLNNRYDHVMGEDFGRSGDLTVMAPMAITDQLKREIPFIVELHNVPFKQQEQVFFYIADVLPRFRGAKLDARGNGQYLAEQVAYRYGRKIEQVMLSQSWYLENMPRLKAAFEDQSIALPKDSEILDDLRAISVVKGIPRLPAGKTDKNKTRHGDAAIAIVMALAASYEDAEPAFGATIEADSGVYQPQAMQNRKRSRMFR